MKAVYLLFIAFFLFVFAMISLIYNIFGDQATFWLLIVLALLISGLPVASFIIDLKKFFK